MIKRAYRIGLASAALLFVFGVAALAAPDPGAEARILAYIRENAAPGKPLLITELYNNVFTKPEERKALDKLYNAFFRVPLFVAQYQERFGSPPRLKTIAEQFDLKSPEDAGTLLLVMESDPRVPKFIRRDAATGEIKSVDGGMIRADRRFGQAAEKHLAGWEGAPAPEFSLPGLDAQPVDLAGLRGKTSLIYVWFTGCPPCMQQTPDLVKLDREFEGRGFAIIGANADNLLGLGYDDDVRRKYREKEKIGFLMADWTKESDKAFGSVSIFPTLFLIDSKGVIVQHWVGYTSAETLRAAIAPALAAQP